MFGHALALPTLLTIVPAAGGLMAMSLLTRTSAAIMSCITFIAQTALLVLGAVQLSRFDDAHAGVSASCDLPGVSEASTFVLARCGTWFPQWGIQYHVVLSWAALGLLALTALVTFSATLFSWWADRDRPAVIIGLLWLSAAALSLLFVARDLVLFYVAFEVMLVPLLVLVGAWGAQQRVRAALTMFIYTLLGSLPMLVAVIAVGRAATSALQSQGVTTQLTPFSLPVLGQLAAQGTLHLSTWTFVAFLLAFAIKAPLIPLHGWLPLAYRQAPAEVAAVLSGLVSKAAMYGALVILVPLYGHQLQGGWGTALVWLSLASLLYGSLAAFRQPDMRGVVAYSSLAQMGLIFLGLTAVHGHAPQQAVSGAYLQTLNHGLVSAAAFLLVGIVELRTGEHAFARLDGLGRGRARLTSVALVVALMTLAVPGATTFAGELLIVLGAFRGAVAGPLVGSLAALAVVLAAMYALRLVAGWAFTDGDASDETAMTTARERFGDDLSLRECAVLALPIVALVVLSVWPNLAHRAFPSSAPLAPAATQSNADGVATLKESS